FDRADVPDEADCVVLGNPNQPHRRARLDPQTITALVRRERLLVVDESFIDFVPSEEASVAGPGEVPGLVVVRSLTKLWSLAVIRAGYLLASAELIEQLAAQRQPWSVNALARAALAVC